MSTLTVVLPKWRELLGGEGGVSIKLEFSLTAMTLYKVCVESGVRCLPTDIVKIEWYAHDNGGTLGTLEVPLQSAMPSRFPVSIRLCDAFGYRLRSRKPMSEAKNSGTVSTGQLP
ncbi:hypothetical protein cyc_01628 [Cyclospora cayetanensis]|uniref:Uncharacterized protein n=1 Tax=Cyclospora cayetanensis TaxID=88456 RepID=A0A1D3D234_9EIME|nr:hypothetical protein cyc_01628 [Cyclospora cayetanensis]